METQTIETQTPRLVSIYKCLFCYSCNNGNEIREELQATQLPQVRKTYQSNVHRLNGDVSTVTRLFPKMCFYPSWKFSILHLLVTNGGRPDRIELIPNVQSIV